MFNKYEKGVVQFEKDVWRKKKLFYVNVIPRENPNRYIKPPPPYCYHPELFPELAVNNPEPVIHTFPARRSSKVEKFPNQFINYLDKIKWIYWKHK